MYYQKYLQDMNITSFSRLLFVQCQMFSKLTINRFNLFLCFLKFIIFLCVNLYQFEFQKSFIRLNLIGVTRIS